MEFDGRGLAVGIALGVVIGLVLMYVTGSSMWIPILAGIGAILGMNTGWFNRSNQRQGRDRR